MKLLNQRSLEKKRSVQNERALQQPVSVKAHGTVLDEPQDARRRLFLKGFVVILGGFFASTLFPSKAEALVLGSTPSAGVVGVKNAANARVNPATAEDIAALIAGNSVQKKTVILTASGTVHTPSSGKAIHLYNCKFSLDANMTSVSFRYTSGGTDFEKYLAPRTGGLYGTNNHPNYKEGAVDQALYCIIDGTGSVQINIDYLEV